MIKTIMNWMKTQTKKRNISEGIGIKTALVSHAARSLLCKTFQVYSCFEFCSSVPTLGITM